VEKLTRARAAACRSDSCSSARFWRTSRPSSKTSRSVEAIRSRPLDAGPYTYLWLDALTQKVREGGRIVNIAVVVATGVNAAGFREILGMDLVTSEDGAGWLAFVRSLVARGLSSVRLVVSDAHPGLVDAIASTLPGAAWQRCRTHFLRNLLAKVPKSARPVRRDARAFDLRAAGPGRGLGPVPSGGRPAR